MIVALSRFRVANGVTDAIREAFLNRPHLVDGVVGFLGMEVFDDTQDTAIFYLMTRWTDAEAFRLWHHSDAHRLSHRHIPRGLKVDRAFTQLFELNRLEENSDHAALERLAMDQAPLLGHFLAQSQSISLIVAAHDGTIRACNELVAAQFNAAKAELVGAKLWRFLTEPDAAMLQAKLVAGNRHPNECMLLNFVSASHAPFTLSCRFDLLPGAFVMIGEPVASRVDYSEELLQLNNELAVLSRENVRKSRELESALAQLKDAQTMLVQREKLASLGVMTAGIAHEINNPVAFVLNNQATLRRDFTDLLGVIRVVSDCLGAIQKTSPEAYQRIADKVAKAELDYLATVVPQKLAANEEGLLRVKQIILDLRTFTRLDEGGMKSCDLAENITAAMRFLEPFLKEQSVAVEMDLAKLQPLVCAPGPLNQVLSNIVVNAVQASQRGQLIRIVTRGDEVGCVIEVHDAGCGIAPEHLPKVLDPFFTTKPIGAGTGLGLSIAHQVVVAHHGELQIESKLGQGTTVRIRLPWGQRNDGSAEFPEKRSCS